MLCDDLAMKVNEDFSIRTHHPLILIVSIQLTAVDASVQKGRALILAIRGVYQAL
jgi:hypothetical protein